VAVERREIPALDALLGRAHETGATEGSWVDARELARREPTLRAQAAIDSPATGIVDGHELLRALLADARAGGCDVAFGQDVIAIERAGDRWRVMATDADGARSSLDADLIVNAAGLAADRIAAMCGIDVAAQALTIAPYAGAYFTVASGAPRTRCPLIYPLPTEGGLGIHITEDLGGTRLAGPDARPVRTLDYDVDEALAPAFARSVARYLPGVEAIHLSPAYAGIRPKLRADDGTFGDFVVADGATLGAPGTIQLVGIESPGLTACLAIAERVFGLARGRPRPNDRPS
jgi:L-2-hydroxyglutarate oxidase LhgO